MNKDSGISEKWVKASIIGTIWAAAEIVLGSFLHNLKVPFCGNILTGIGLVILISISYIWNEKGLFWRAGLICAVMKTLSPSAVIFGPMIAIFSESVLLEISVRIFGRTIAGFLFGSMLAMSWNLFQKTINLIIFYGNKIIDLYTNLVIYAEKQLNIHFDIFWLPLIILLILYCIFGLVSAVIGIKIGQKVLRQPAEIKSPYMAGSFVANPKSGSGFNYSLLWLGADIVLIIGLLALVNNTPWVYWVLSVTPVITIWSLRYERALRQVSKPKFWIVFIIITMVSAFIFTSVQSDIHSIEQGLLIGIQMNFRAVIIIVGFSVLGTELYNPRIRDLFLKTHFKQLPLALELSTSSLPSMIAAIPDFKTIIKNPVSILYEMIAGVEFRLAELKANIRPAKKVLILSGDVGGGKTTFVQELIKSFRDSDIAVGGIYAPGIIENGKTIGYDIVDIRNDHREIFLRQTGEDNLKKVGRFKIFQRGLETGLEALRPENNINNKIVIIDEVGPLELRDEGWAGRIRELIDSSDNHLLMVVRKSLIEKVIQKWNLRDYSVQDISDHDHSVTVRSILKQIG